jgi:hypothetical protein
MWLNSANALMPALVACNTGHIRPVILAKHAADQRGA